MSIPSPVATFAALLLWSTPSGATGQMPPEAVPDLADNPTVAEALRVVETLEPRTAADHITLTEIPAPPFLEAERAAVYLDWLIEAGADTAFIDEVELDVLDHLPLLAGAFGDP